MNVDKSQKGLIMREVKKSESKVSKVKNLHEKNGRDIALEMSLQTAMWLINVISSNLYSLAYNITISL